MSRINSITIGPRRQDEVTYAIRLEPNPLREQIQADIEAYLARGGAILPAPQSPKWSVKQSRDGGSWVTRPSALDKYVTKTRKGGIASSRAQRLDKLLSAAEQRLAGMSGPWQESRSDRGHGGDL